jgi:hypothetical protein
MWKEDLSLYNILGEKEEAYDSKKPRQTPGGTPIDSGDLIEPEVEGQYQEEEQEEIEYQNIMIATEDSIKNRYLINALV